MEITTVLFTGLSTFISALVAYIFGLRKSKAQTDGIILANANEINSMYKDLNREIKSQMDEMHEMLELQRKQINNYKLRCIQPLKCQE